MDIPPLNWTPLLKKNSSNIIENYVDQAQTINIVQTVFIGIGLMVAAALIAVLFIWAWQKGGAELFIGVYSLFVLAYVAKVVTLIGLIRDKLSTTIFQLYLGSAAAMGLLSIGFVITFFVSYSRRLKMTSSGIQQPLGRDYPVI
jgi:hypothetical protein